MARRPDFGDKPVDFLLNSLQSADWYERAEAARTLCNRKVAGKDVFDKLVSLRNDPCYFVRIQVVRATSHLDGEVEQVKAILNDMLGDENEIVRSYAEAALKSLSPTTNPSNRP
jgi:HEAT repeat protein